jgi:hypothetical protein
MKKFLLVLFLFIVVVVVMMLFIPVTRTLILNLDLNKVLSGIHFRSGSGPVSKTAEGNQPSQKTFPEPGIERIKSDLIGKQIPGWSFDRITEFRQAAITSIARTDERIDFRLDLHMLPYNSKDESYYDTQIFATYLAGEDDWYLNKVEEIFITFDIQIPPGRWVTINSVPNCNLQPDEKNNLVWTSKTWDYEIISGPGIGEVILPPAASYDVKARAKHPVRIKLKFRPAG